MPIKLAPDQRSFLLDVKRHARTLMQYYAARSLLALDSGEPPRVVAEKFGLPLGRIESWSRQYQRIGADYIVDLGHPGRLDRARRAIARRSREIARAEKAEKEALAAQRRRIQEITPKMVDLIKLAKTPSAKGADLEADPANLFLAD